MKLPTSMTDVLFNLMLLFIFLSALGQPLRTEEPAARVPPHEAAARRVPLKAPREPVRAERGEVELPHIEGDFTTVLGFDGYRSGMSSIGGRFFVKDGNDRIVAEVDAVAWTLQPPPAALSGLSARWREFGDTGAFRQLLDAARERFGEEAESVVLLLPVAVERRIADALHAFATRQGVAARDVNRVFATYVPAPRGLVMEVYRVDLRDGNTLDVRFRIAL